MEANENGCRVSMVIGNRTRDRFSASKLDMLLFRPEGGIGNSVISSGEHIFCHPAKAGTQYSIADSGIYWIPACAE